MTLFGASRFRDVCQPSATLSAVTVIAGATTNGGVSSPSSARAPAAAIARPSSYASSATMATTLPPCTMSSAIGSLRSRVTIRVVLLPLARSDASTPSAGPAQVT